jgi:hypothetical protein
MPNYAVVSRLFQFCAGPERQRFYACVKHQGDIADGPPSSVFLSFVYEADKQTEYHSEEDEYQCDYCRGEDGP